MNNAEDVCLQITSPSFDNLGFIPIKHTGFGEDISPEFRITGLCDKVQSIAITMDDLDIPVIGELNHWLIWNIPKTDVIPEGLPCGEVLASYGNAIQGIGYGKHRYRGPKQPPFVKSAHRYKFTFYALDTFIDISHNSKKEQLINAINGHIVQTGYIVGLYKK